MQHEAFIPWLPRVGGCFPALVAPHRVGTHRHLQENRANLEQHEGAAAYEPGENISCLIEQIFCSGITFGIPFLLGTAFAALSPNAHKVPPKSHSVMLSPASFPSDYLHPFETILPSLPVPRRERAWKEHSVLGRNYPC